MAWFILSINFVPPVDLCSVSTTVHQEAIFFSNHTDDDCLFVQSVACCSGAGIDLSEHLYFADSFVASSFSVNFLYTNVL